MMEKIVRDAPCHVVAKAVRESLDEARRSSESQDDQCAQRQRVKIKMSDVEECVWKYEDNN